MSNWVKIIEIRSDPIKEVDSFTGKALEKEYLFFKEFCLLHRNPQPTIEYFNRNSTPENLKKHWENYDLKKIARIRRIREMMKKYGIKKSEI